MDEGRWLGGAPNPEGKGRIPNITPGDAGIGGWSAADLESVMTTGTNAPVVVPGDPENSLLAQKLLGVQESGALMPPSGTLPDAEIRTIIDWITAGADQ